MPETVVHFQIRMPPALQEKLSGWAKQDKVSLNALVDPDPASVTEPPGSYESLSRADRLTGARRAAV